MSIEERNYIGIGNKDWKDLNYYSELLESLLCTEVDVDGFKKVYSEIIEELRHPQKFNEDHLIVESCLKNLKELILRCDLTDRFDELVEVTENILSYYGKEKDVEFVLYEIYESLLEAHIYYSVLNCEIVGEGAQVRRLLRKKFKADDNQVAEIVAERMLISKRTAVNYLNRRVIPYKTFHRFIENLFEHGYYEVVQSPKKKMVLILEKTIWNIGIFEDEFAVMKVEYLLDKAKEIDYAYAEILAKICYARQMGNIKNEKWRIIIDEALKKAKGYNRSLYIFALSHKAAIMMNYQRTEEALCLLEPHIKTPKKENLNDNYLSYYYLRMGLCYYYSNDLLRAKRVLELALKNPGNVKIEAVILNSIGLVLRKQKKYSASIRYYKKVLKVTADKEKHLLAYNNMAYVYMQYEDFDNIFKCTEVIIKLIKYASLFSERLNFYDTLLEVIIMSGYGYNGFLTVFDEILKELDGVDVICGKSKPVLNCINKMIEIIEIHGNKEISLKLTKCLARLIENMIES